MTYGASAAVTYSYDNAGRLLTKTLPNGITTTYTYDDANRLTSLINRRSDASIISSFAYTHDNVGNRLTMTETSGTHNYNYDNIYRLLGALHPAASNESYSYDRVGNRLSSAAEPSWNYDANNRLLSYDGVTYNHDNNGNRTARTTTSSLTEYSYDFENRLETVDGGFITYEYSPNGKRLAKTVGGVKTHYLYDGDDIIGEYDAAGTLIASYIHGPGIDEPIEMTRGGSTVYYTMDGLGSVRNLTTSTQTVVEQYDYDSFGNLTNPPTTGNPYTYTSREYDPETGLLFYRARYYDPKVGRFLQQDPKGFDGGDVNFYAYVAGNPINAVDPMGEEITLDEVLDMMDAVGYHLEANPVPDEAVLRCSFDQLAGALLLGSTKLIRTARASKKLITVIGARADALKYLGKKGYNVLNIENWTEAKNLKWLDEAIERGDIIMMVTDPVKHQKLMQELNKPSAFLDLELPHLFEKGFIQQGQYLVK